MTTSLFEAIRFDRIFDINNINHVIKGIYYLNLIILLLSFLIEVRLLFSLWKRPNPMDDLKVAVTRYPVFSRIFSAVVFFVFVMQLVFLLFLVPKRFCRTAELKYVNAIVVTSLVAFLLARVAPFEITYSLYMDIFPVYINALITKQGSSGSNPAPPVVGNIFARADSFRIPLDWLSVLVHVSAIFLVSLLFAKAKRSVAANR